MGTKPHCAGTHSLAPSPPMRALRRLRRLSTRLGRDGSWRQRGAISAEYIALIVVVVAALAVVAASTGVSEAITGRITALIEGIGGDGPRGGAGDGSDASGDSGELPPGQTFGPGGGEHANDPTGTQSDPVNSLTGAFESQVTDARMPAPGVPFAFVRSYTSADRAEGPLGRGWTHAYAARLVRERSGDMTLWAGDGQRVRFVRGAEGYAAAPGVRSRLLARPQGFEVVTQAQIRYRFDAGGRLLAIEDRNGNTVRLTYGHGPHPVRITDAAGREIRLSYGPGQRLTGLRLPDGRLARYAYDDEGRLASVRDMAGGTTRYAYDQDDRLERITDPLGHVVVENEYSGDGRVERQTDALGEESTFDWDEDEHTQTMEDARGNEWRHVYDERGNLVAQEDPLGNVTRTAYDLAHRPVAVTDPNGHTTRLAYDRAGNLAARIAPAPLRYRQTFAYEADNELARVTDAKGRTTRLEYDGRGNVTEVIRADGTSQHPLRPPRPCSRRD